MLFGKGSEVSQAPIAAINSLGRRIRAMKDYARACFRACKALLFSSLALLGAYQAVAKFQVWAPKLGPYPLLPCFCGVQSIGGLIGIWNIVGIKRFRIGDVY